MRCMSCVHVTRYIESIDMKQSNYDTLATSVQACITRCSNAISEYEKQKCIDTSDKQRKAKNKALRKALKIARCKTQLKRASAINELLHACDNNHALLSQCSKFTLTMCAMLSEAQERETFFVCRNDNMMSVYMRYDNFSKKKLLKYCEAHKIVINSDNMTFNFTNAIDIVDSIDDVDDDDSDDDSDD